MFADPNPDPAAKINADPDTDPDPKPCFRPVVAGWHHFDEEFDPDQYQSEKSDPEPDPFQSEKSDLDPRRIRIEMIQNAEFKY